MRILHVGKYFPPFSGGIESFTADLMVASRAQGVESAAIVHDHTGGGAGIEGTGGLTVHRVPTHGELLHAPLSPGFGRHLTRMIGEWRPDLLHVHLPNTSAFWLLGRRRPKLPMVLHWHSDVVGPGMETRLRLAYPAYRPFEQALLRRAEAVVATSPPYLASSAALRPWQAKCAVVPLGLDPQRVRATDSTGSTAVRWRLAGGLKVLAVGRLARYKGLEFLVRAVAKTPDTELVVVGDGPERDALERLVARLGAGDRVRLAGRTDDAARNDWLRSCDLLCLPSVNRGEAFGLVLLEAMAVGKPCLVTRVAGSGMAWVVEDGQTGWHVTPGDADALARKLAAIAAQRETLAALGAQARERFQARFSLPEVTRRMVALYHTVLDGRPPAGAGSDTGRPFPSP